MFMDKIMDQSIDEIWLALSCYVYDWSWMLDSWTFITIVCFWVKLFHKKAEKS